MVISDIVSFTGHKRIADGETGKITRFINDGRVAEVKLDSGSKVCTPIEKLEILTAAQTIGEKPPIEVIYRQAPTMVKAEYRADMIFAAAVDVEAIEDEKISIDQNIDEYKKKILRLLEDKKRINKVIEIAKMHSRRVSKMKISDAAAIVEVKNIPEVNPYSK